jgi:hypothetical protein
MTTAHSPLRLLKAQSDGIAAALNAVGRGEKVIFDRDGKISDSMKRGFVTFAVAMDDKIIKLEMPWSLINETSEAGLSEYILRRMRESRDTIQ